MSAEPEWQTLIQIANAQTVCGIPPLRPLVPHRNISALLLEKTRRNPEQVFLAHIDEAGARICWTYRAFEDETNWMAHCRSRLGFDKSPKVVVFGQDAPVTATGKYQRLLLRQHFTSWRETQFRNDAPEVTRPTVREDGD